MARSRKQSRPRQAWNLRRKPLSSTRACRHNDRHPVAPVGRAFAEVASLCRVSGALPGQSRVRASLGSIAVASTGETGGSARLVATQGRDDHGSRLHRRQATIRLCLDSRRSPQGQLPDGCMGQDGLADRGGGLRHLRGLDACRARGSDRARELTSRNLHAYPSEGMRAGSAPK